MTSRAPDAPDAPEWIGVEAVAVIFGCSVRTVQKSFAPPEDPDATYGRGQWRDRAHPLGRRTVYQVRRARVLEMKHQHDNPITGQETGSG